MFSTQCKMVPECGKGTGFLSSIWYLPSPTFKRYEGNSSALAVACVHYAELLVACFRGVVNSWEVELDMIAWNRRWRFEIDWLPSKREDSVVGSATQTITIPANCNIDRRMSWNIWSTASRLQWWVITISSQMISFVRLRPCASCESASIWQVLPELIGVGIFKAGWVVLQSSNSWAATADDATTRIWRSRDFRKLWPYVVTKVSPVPHGAS